MLAILRILALASALLHLVGCGTYKNEIASRVPAAELAQLVYNGPMAGVSVSHVDGESRGIGLYDKFDLAPGLRTVTVFLNLPATRSSPITLEFSADPGGKYELLYSTSPGAAGSGTWRIWIVNTATGTTVSRRVPNNKAT